MSEVAGRGAEGMKIVVTGGGTTAAIDDVRHIANASTGSFAARICEHWLERGATVRHVVMPGADAPYFRSVRFLLNAEEVDRELDRLAELRRSWLAVRDRYHAIPVVSGSATEYSDRLEATLAGEPADVVMLVAAVSDYEPEPTPGKIASDADELIIRCRRTPKVIRKVRDWAPGAFLVGFKLLSGSTEADLIRAAQDANRENRGDLTIANDLRLYRAGRHVIHLVMDGEAVESLGPGDGDLAGRLVDRILQLVNQSGDSRRGNGQR